jgi:predicted amidohydrolase YtcJ
MREKALVEILPQLHAAGITSYMEANTSAQTVQTYVDLARKGGLTARVNIALASDGEATEEEFARLKKLRTLAESQPLLRADVVKLFADGVMEYPTQTAALLEPYQDAQGHPTQNSGRLYYEPKPFADFVSRADQEGFGVHVHAIGDRAVRAALDAFEAARRLGSQRTYSIAHLQLIDPEDLPRFKALNVFASVQLLWAHPENYSVEALLPYIGAQRQARIYPARSLAAAGGTIVGGSDWSVSSFNPFEAIATAISRTNPKEPRRGALGPREIMTLKEMLAAYTIDAARMLGRQQQIGSLEPGKAADLIVLDRRLEESTPADKVRSTRVAYTFGDGRLLIGPASP